MGSVPAAVRVKEGAHPVGCPSYSVADRCGADRVAQSSSVLINGEKGTEGEGANQSVGLRVDALRCSWFVAFAGGPVSQGWMHRGLRSVARGSSSYAEVFPHPVPVFSLSYELKNLFGSKTSFRLSMK